MLLRRHYHGNGRCSCGCCVRDRLSDWDETIRSRRRCWTTPWNSWSVKWTHVQVWLTARCSHELLLHAVLLLSQLLVHIWKNKSPVSSLCLDSYLSVKIAISCIVSKKLLVWWQEEHPACKNWVVRYWRGYLSGARWKWFAYGPADATATPSSLAPVKSGMVYLSGVGLPRLSCKKGRKWM